MLPLLQHELNRAHLENMRRQAQIQDKGMPKPASRRFAWHWPRRKPSGKESQPEREFQPVF